MFNFFSGSKNNIDCDTFEKLMNDGYTIIDVRTPEEYSDARISNCQLIDYYSSDFKNKISELDKNKKYLVYCHSGSRSGQATSYMIKTGFTDVRNLSGGISRWHSEGRKILSGK